MRMQIGTFYRYRMLILLNDPGINNPLEPLLLPLLLQLESFLHIVKEGRYTWRHDSILYLLANSFQSIKNAFLHVDVPGFISPCALTGATLRPDLLLVIPDKCLYILELTVCFETNLRNNSHRKQLKYKTRLERKQQKNFNEVRYINMSMSALGVFDHLSKSFIDMLQDLNFDEATKNYLIRRTMTITIKTTYYIFCRRSKDWALQNFLSLKFA